MGIFRLFYATACSQVFLNKCFFLFFTSQKFDFFWERFFFPCLETSFQQVLFHINIFFLCYKVWFNFSKMWSIFWLTFHWNLNWRKIKSFGFDFFSHGNPWQLLRCSTAMWSISGLSLGFPTKVEAHKYFLFAGGSLRVENKENLFGFVVTI